MEGQITTRRDDFWKQMYEQAAADKRLFAQKASAYRRRAEVAEFERQKLRKAVLMIGMFAASGLCAIFWISRFAGVM